MRKKSCCSGVLSVRGLTNACIQSHDFLKFGPSTIKHSSSFSVDSFTCNQMLSLRSLLTPLYVRNRWSKPYCDPFRYAPQRVRQFDPNLVSVKFIHHLASFRGFSRRLLVLRSADTNVSADPHQLLLASKLSQSSGDPSRINLNSDFLARLNPATNAASFLNGNRSPDPL